ncbi:MAG: B12-binding domain-containing radical SAM protein [Caldilineales bacterium]|nr:B12-binding domain-containing radical SAM protein [Caldilineales bacterium]MDW8317664.1 radical SAM protein [Anaerolineae bacterium]
MRVLFIEKQIDYEPQGIMQLSACLKQAGHETFLAIAAQEDPVQLAKEIEPDIVAYSVMTGSHQWYFDINRRVKAALKDKAPFSIFGGPHPTFFPEMITEPGVDGLCVGEGDEAIVDLANSLANGGLKPDIPNWWFKIEDEIVRNPVRPLIQNLGDLPMPDRHLVYDKHEYSRITPIKHFMGSRGCPYNCTYCFNHAYYQIYSRERRGNQRPVDKIIEEVNWVRREWGVQQVVFIDDLFIIYDDWLEEFAEKWPKQVGLPFFCNVRANLIVKGPHKVELLKKAGCSTVSMGVEAANDRIRVQLLKRRMTQEDMIKAGRMIRDAGIHITSTNILGLPSSTLEDDLATMRLNAAARISYAHAFLFQPYPGTELGKFAQDGGYMVGSFDDISEIAWERSILIFENEDEKPQVEHLQRWFAIGVEFPWLEPVIRWLIKAPHNKVIDTLYWWIYKLFKGWMLKRRVHPARMGVKDLFTAAKQLMAIRS